MKPDLIEAAARRLFMRNVADYADTERAEFAWITDDDLRAFWIAQVETVLGEAS